MALPLCIGWPDIFYHVLFRGNEKRPVYYEPADYLIFLELLEKTLEKYLKANKRLQKLIDKIIDERKIMTYEDVTPKL